MGQLERKRTMTGDARGDVLVLGLGTTGRDVARYLVGRARSVTLYGGASSRENATIRELRAAGVRVVLGTEDVKGRYDLAVVSPGIPESSPFFQAAHAHARELVGEPELAWRESPDRWVVVTGTNGKTTTTTLACALLRAGGLSAEAVGNIGTSAISAVETRAPGSWFVAELSSYQLATSSCLHPRVAALLNVTPDHLSWHGDIERYAAAKERAFANLTPGDLAVVCVEDARCQDVASRLEARGLRVCRVLLADDPAGEEAAFVRDGRLVVRLRGVEHALARVDDLGVKGRHNVLNALAASALACESGVADDAASDELVRFVALEHRIEACGDVAGVSYVNDSKATNVEATLAALATFAPGTVVLLLGGTDKGVALEGLSSVVARRCRGVVCFGAAGPRMASSVRAAVAEACVETPVLEASHLADALVAAESLARPGDVVLLSPACSSFDEFSNFEERGRVFKRLVAQRANQDREVTS